MNDDFLQKKEDALCVLDRLVPLVFDAEKRLSHARNWSFIDVLGGGFFVNNFLLYISPNPRDRTRYGRPSSA